MNKTIVFFLYFSILSLLFWKGKLMAQTMPNETSHEPYLNSMNRVEGGDTLLLQTLPDSSSTAPVIDEISVEDYVNTYWHIAVLEMKRTGIPASITLAQGIMESKYGNSRLARKANNHFGVKCRSDWHGGKAFKSDEEANECFRRYPTPIHSFVDHSTFLAANQRYAFLFLLDLHDFRAWANGLEELGYSTSGHYAEKLITIIESKNLGKYDYFGSKNDTLINALIEPGAYYQKYVQRAYTKKARSLEEVKIIGKNTIDKLHEFHKFDEENGYTYLLKEENESLILENMGNDMHNEPSLTQQYDQAEPKIINLLNKTVPVSQQQSLNEEQKYIDDAQKLNILPSQATTPTINTQHNSTADANHNNIPSYTLKYTVQAGETVNTIAQYFKIDPQEIIQTNNLSHNNKLEAGQALIIPIK